MAVCLLPDQIENFKQALKDKDLSLTDLLDPKMTSEARTEIFKEYAGANAADVNKLFEQKIVLKNQMLGITNLFNKLIENGKYSPENVAAAKESLAQFRAAQQERILSPNAQQTFLNTLADKLAGTHISKEVSAKVFELTQKADEARASVKEDDPVGSDSRLEYGAAKVAADNYVSGIKRGAEKLTVQDFKDKPFASSRDAVIKTMALAKELKSTGDVSSILRQGLKVIFSHPLVWLKNSAQAFVDAAKQAAKKGTNTDVRDAIQADIVSRPNAMNGMYKKMGLDINTDEELYPSQSAEKIPGIGRLTAISRTGYESFLHRTRADLADHYIDIAQKSGVDLEEEGQLTAIGKMVNSQTGRGDVGTREGAALNAAFWSPRMIKSNFDFLTAHQFEEGVTPFVRTQAAYNLVKTIAGVAAVLATAKAMNPKSVTFDTRSTDFGKIKVGKISFDVTGGSGTLVVLASRLIQNSEVTGSGKVTKLNTGKFGAPTSGDVIWNFLSGKASPAASLALAIANRSGFGGAPLTIQDQAVQTFAPFPVQNIMQGTPDVGLAGAIAGELVDSLGAYETLPYVKPKRK